MCTYRREIDSFTLLKEYLESINGNIEEFHEIYNCTVQHLNDIVSSL